MKKALSTPTKYLNPYTDFEFKKLFGEEGSKDSMGVEVAELAHLKPKQFDDYQKSLLEYWEVKNVKDTAFEEGKIAQRKEIANNMLALGLAIDVIAQTTGLTIAE